MTSGEPRASLAATCTSAAQKLWWLIVALASICAEAALKGRAVGAPLVVLWLEGGRGGSASPAWGPTTAQNDGRAGQQESGAVLAAAAQNTSSRPVAHTSTPPMLQVGPAPAHQTRRQACQQAPSRCEPWNRYVPTASLHLASPPGAGSSAGTPLWPLAPAAGGSQGPPKQGRIKISRCTGVAGPRLPLPPLPCTLHSLRVGEFMNSFPPTFMVLSERVRMPGTRLVLPMSCRVARVSNSWRMHGAVHGAPLSNGTLRAKLWSTRQANTVTAPCVAALTEPSPAPPSPLHPSNHCSARASWTPEPAAPSPKPPHACRQATPIAAPLAPLPFHSPPLAFINASQPCIVSCGGQCRANPASSMV